MAQKFEAKVMKGLSLVRPVKGYVCMNLGPYNINFIPAVATVHSLLE